MAKKRSRRKVEDMSAVPAPETGPDAGAVWHYGDPLGEQRAAADGAVVVDRSHRAVLTLTGNDRKTWLHNISTQHVSDLPDGAVTQNLSLDGQGRVEDHWIQTRLDGVTYLDTEPWRGEPLLTYLRRMVFWSDVAVEPADLAVLSLLGPRLADPAVLDALGVGSLPAKTRRWRCPTAVSCAGWPARASNWTWWCRAIRPPMATATRPPRVCDPPASGPTRRIGWPRCGPASASTPTSGRSRTRSAGSAAAGAPGQGLLPRPGDRRARPQPGQTAPDAGPAAPRRLHGPAGDRRSRACGRTRRSAGSAPSSTTSTTARSRWRCSSAACPPTRELTTGGEVEVRRGDRRRLDAARRRGRRGTAGGGTAARRSTLSRDARCGPASAAQRGTVKCWQDNKHTQIGAA